MHRLTAAVLALLQCMAIFACQLKSSEVPRSRRSIIGAPMFAYERFGQDQRRSVVGYDGQFRQMFQEAADDNTCCSAYFSSRRCTEQQPAGPEKQRSVINNDAWWLAVIENTNRNNKQVQDEMENKEAWRKYEWALSFSQ